MFKIFKDSGVFWPSVMISSMVCGFIMAVLLFGVHILKWYYLIPYGLTGFIWTLGFVWYDITGPRGYGDKQLFADDDGLPFYLLALLLGTIGWPFFLVYGIVSKIDTIKPVKIVERMEEKKKRSLQNTEIVPTEVKKK